MSLSFSPERLRGMTYKFNNTSSEIPEGLSPLWDFGDGIGTSTAASPNYTYSEPGTYIVKLSYGENLSHEVSVSIYARTKSILPLQDISKSYIPPLLFTEFDSKKEALIDKWQLYIHPLVNRDIPEAYYYVEDYYEALEVELMAQLVAHDFLLSEITKYMVGTITSSSEVNPDGSGEVKKIITGPTEAEFFSDQDSAAKLAKALSEINKPGGIMDGLKMNICQLASRLGIYLPMCGLPSNIVRHFEIAKR